MAHKPDDNPELTDADFAKLRPAAEVLPAEVIAAFKSPRGRPKAESPKVAIKLRIDQAVVEFFKAAGPGWQTRMNEVLAAAANPTISNDDSKATPRKRA